jgi:hypothetical protein
MPRVPDSDMMLRYIPVDGTIGKKTLFRTLQRERTWTVEKCQKAFDRLHEDGRIRIGRGASIQRTAADGGGSPEPHDTQTAEVKHTAPAGSDTSAGQSVHYKTSDQDEDGGEAKPDTGDEEDEDEEEDTRALNDSGRTDIKVESKPLSEVIYAIGKGEYRIPQFQRDYVWEKGRVCRLLDSIVETLPIGSIFIWRAGRENNRFARQLVGVDAPPVKDGDDVSFVLDGQQRLASLYFVLRGRSTYTFDHRRICFDLRKKRFVVRDADRGRYWSVADIWEFSDVEPATLSQDQRTAAKSCWKLLQKYPVSVVEVSNKTLPQVKRIFERINQGGKRLNRFDLISVHTWTSAFDLREKVANDVNHKLRDGFGTISPGIVTQIIALWKKDGCAWKHEYQLKAKEDIQDNWGDTVRSILSAVQFLRDHCGVRRSEMLPYEAMLILLAYAFARSRRPLSPGQITSIKQWFWRASFGQRYGSHVAETIREDKAFFDKLIDGECPEFRHLPQLSVDHLISTKITKSDSAIRNAFLCLLAQRGPTDLLDGSPIDVGEIPISDLRDPEKHHIFPKAHLTGPNASQEHALANICFLSRLTGGSEQRHLRYILLNLSA